MFTHLGNGCPLLLPRHDNIIHLALDWSDRLWIGWIADGVHVPPIALRNYLLASPAWSERSWSPMQSPPPDSAPVASN